MKQILILILLFTTCVAARAQHEIANDSLPPLSTPSETAADRLLPETRSFGGFLIDMTLMNLQAPPRFSDFKLEIPDASKDYSQLFRLNPNITYSQGTAALYTPGSSLQWGGSYFGIGGSTPATLQMSSFKLKNGLRINTYGQYNKEGRKVYDPAALPWERNDFKGAFELKSANGAFGVRIEVQQHR